MNQINQSGNVSGSQTIDKLIDQLTCDDMAMCREARHQLVAIGSPAVDSLIAAISGHGHKEWVRWEATKALGEIADPKAIEPLIDRLEDKNFDIRWMAAESLVPFGQAVFGPLLRRLIERPQSSWLRLAAHHVMRLASDQKTREIVKPVLEAIESNDPAPQIPHAAKSALDRLR